MTLINYIYITFNIKILFASTLVEIILHMNQLEQYHILSGYINIFKQGMIYLFDNNTWIGFRRILINHMSNKHRNKQRLVTDIRVH